MEDLKDLSELFSGVKTEPLLSNKHWGTYLQDELQ